MDKIKILILEDELAIRELIQVNLEMNKDYEVICTASGKDAICEYNKTKDFDIAILDIMLPDISGYDVCQAIRSQDNHIGIIMLSAKSMERDKIEGLAKGADDYITKPFSPSELTARIKALLRRVIPQEDSNEQLGDIISAGPFKLDTKTRHMYRGIELIELSALEFRLIMYMIKREKEAVTRQELLDDVWGKDAFIEMKVIDVTIRRIRVKIEETPSDPKYLTTVWGYGYRWSSDV